MIINMCPFGGVCMRTVMTAGMMLMRSPAVWPEDLIDRIPASNRRLLAS